MTTINGQELTAGELAVYRRAAGRARLAYKRKHGTHATPVPASTWSAGTSTWSSDAARDAFLEEMAARVSSWELEHRARYDAAADRAGVSAVKRMLSGYAADPRHAVEYGARLEVLGLSGARRRTAPKTAAPAVEVVEVPAAPELRKTSKLVTCTGHAAFYARFSGARRWAAVVEGGAGTACTGGRCVLTPGTDRYAADFVAAGPVDVMAVNGTPELEAVESVVPVADVVPIRPELERVPDVVHVSATAGDRTGPLCRLVDDVATRDDVDVPAGVSCDGCRVALESIDAGPAVVPAPMPTMTRAARKASNVELAARMRAAGLTPSGDAWRLAKAGVPIGELAAAVARLEGVAGGVS